VPTAAALLGAQLRLSYLPPGQQLAALAAAVAPHVAGAAWGDVVALLDALATSGHHPGEQVGPPLVTRAPLCWSPGCNCTTCPPRRPISPTLGLTFPPPIRPIPLR
jgi:hypothetical protein